MRRRASTPLLAALLGALLSSPASASVSFTPCAQQPGFACASVPVPLDRSGAVPGTISLRVAKRTAPTGPGSVAVVALAGGPGQATLPLAQFIEEAVAPALGTRDLLLFDQRGTGASGALSCAALTAAELRTANSFSEVIQRCARQLGPARGAYTTRESVEDLDAIRQAAGYEKLVLYGTSYGTKVALDYAERHPQNVAGLVLDSTETPDGPEPFHISTFKAIRPALEELCGQRGCSRVSATPLRDLARLVAATNRRPLVGHAYDSRGRRVRRAASARTLFDLLLAGDLNPVIRAELPAAVHSALHGDAGPLARLLTVLSVPSAREEKNGSIDETLFITTSCEETPFPWQRGAPEATRAVEAEAALNSLPGSDFYPFDSESALLDMTIPLCVAWPDASTPPPPGGPLPDIPTLILSGGQDLRTPTENARRVAALIPDAQLLRVPFTGHSVIGSDLSGCARKALSAFFAGAAVSPCPASANRFPAAPLAPRRLSALSPAASVGGLRGRTVTGAVDSLLDLRRTVIELALDFGEVPIGARFGGLRGGTAQVLKAGVRLQRFSYVPGVQLSGLIPPGILLRNSGGAARLTVGGAAAAHGSLRLGEGGRVSGILDGRRLRANVSAKVKVAHAFTEAAAESPGALRFPIPALARLR